jgi:hypothetical protein
MAQLINGPKRYKQFVKSSLNDIQDPVFLTFDLDFFPADSISPNGDGIFFNALFKEPSPAGSKMYQNPEWSALDWLDAYGSGWTQTTASYLGQAIEQLRLLQESPWYFQGIIGVDQLWKAASRIKEGDKKAEITINCLDSIEQPLLKFAEYYRRAIYDQERLAYALPDNLRTFDMVIRLYEIRDINDISGNLTNGVHQLTYRLQRCEFDFSDFFSAAGSTEIKAYTEEKGFSTSFKIKAGWVIESSEASTESDYHSLGIFSGLASSLEGRAQRFLQSAARLPARVIGDLTNQLQTGLETALAQNVYNRSTEVLSTNQIFGRTSPIGPGAGYGLNDDVYPGRVKLPGGTDYDPKDIVKDGDLGDVYP